MSDQWGNHLRLSIFGESHGKAIGMVVDGLPSGVEIDMVAVQKEMTRRAPGQNNLSTPRKEADQLEVLSGLFQGRTTGTSICGVIFNSDTRSEDYDTMRRLMRPGHADYTAQVRYLGFNDYRGSGHFSGRITAPFLFAGAVCKQFLATKGIEIVGRAKRIGKVEDMPVSYTDFSDLSLWTDAKYRAIPALDGEKAKLMEKAILAAKEQEDSIGGVVEVAALGVLAGLGNPFFDSIESLIAHLAFSVPAVKGIEFGGGFALADMQGSRANDNYYMDSDQIKTRTNYSGGILGGITSGMPLVFRVAVKPPASIGIEQETIDLANKKDTTITVKGRHDPCIVPRAVPVLETVAAIAITEAWLEAFGNQPRP